VATVGFEGTVILVGAGDAASTIDTMLLVKNKIHLAGHHGADADDLRAYWDFLPADWTPLSPRSRSTKSRRRDVIGRLVAVLDDDDG
jgi:hypothetical protein